MHAWLSAVGGACAIIGVLLLVAAFSGLNIGIVQQLVIAIAITLLAVAAIIAWMFYAVVRAHYSKVKTGMEALIGSKGIATTDLTPKGTIRVVGEFWEAVAKEDHIKAGENVLVVGLEGMFVVVEPANEKA